MDVRVPGPEYLDICRKGVTLTSLPIGSERKELLSGLRFCLLGHLGTVKKQAMTHGIVKELILDLLGLIRDNDQSETLLRTHSQLPNCFVIVKDEKDLIFATGSTDEISFFNSQARNKREKKNESQYSDIAKRFGAGGSNF